MSNDEVTDVLVVGGGSAGLTAAIAIARFGKTVEVVDAGEPRNAPAAGVHNLLGHDGISPFELLRRGRAELEGFGGRVVPGHAVDARRVDDGVEVTLDTGRVRRARRLVVASGGRDVLPEVDGLRERWGREVLHCPFCHGWEVRGQRIGVIATEPDVAAHQAALFRELSDDVVILPAADLAAVVVEDDRLTGVRLTDGRVIDRDALVVAPTVVVDSPVLDALGVPQSDDLRTGYVHDAMGATPVPGVWVAGNVGEPFATVVTASAAGMAVGSAVVADIVAEHSRAGVAA